MVSKVYYQRCPACGQRVRTIAAPRKGPYAPQPLVPKKGTPKNLYKP